MNYKVKNFLLFFFVLFQTFIYSQTNEIQTLRKEARKKYNDGNYKESLTDFEKLIYNPDNTPKEVPNDYNYAINCFRNLSRTNEIDQFRDKIIKHHSKNWRLLHKAAETFIHGDHYGYLIAGEFTRGHHRGGGQWKNAFEIDRVEALKLMQKAMNLKPDGQTWELSNFYNSFSQMIQSGRSGTMSWKLRYLTDTSKLPDYEDSYHGRSGTSGAPVDENGTPYFHKSPESYESAQTDGERWRWLINKVMEVNPDEKPVVQYQFAEFLYNQFGVQTMASYGYFSGREDKDSTSHVFSLSSLKENETISKLATGVKRFNLPEEFNYIKILQSIVNDYPHHSYSSSAMIRLAEIFSNRRQYPKAATIWRKYLKLFGKDNYYQKRLSQIVDPWGQFEPVMDYAPGEEASLEYRFRNGNKASFEAFPIEINTLLEDVKTYLKTNPSKLDWDKLNIQNIGHRLIYKNETKYIGEKVANWELKLEPKKAHFDKRVTIKTPLKKAGAYLLTAKMKEGNTSRIIIWINNSVIVKKPLNNDTLFFIADAKTGKPIPGARVDFFGYRQERVKNENILAKVLFRKYNVLTSEYKTITDKHGIVIPKKEDVNSNFNWLITAKDNSGRFAYLGFSGVWHYNYYDHEYNQTKTYLITDRPVYRPNQKVNYKFWIRNAKYDMENTSNFANRSFTVQIFNPRNEKIHEQTIQSDEFGGLDGSYQLPENATLGNYRLNIHNYGWGTTFRVEEYKKPEFEVNIESPTEPVMLGEKISCKVNAKYYFGAPVAKAKVKYKIERSSYQKNWYPFGIWNWLYGPGYWWFAYDYAWYPGFHEWGIKRPHCFWIPRPHDPPELIAENEVEIEDDGTVSIEIDTNLAKEFHSNKDHEYSITAEVVDESRRTIVGTGKVLVARKPFKVYAWVNKGYYRKGDTIHASFLAQTLDNKSVKGKGELKLFKVKTVKDEVEEVEVQKWTLDTDEQGTASTQIKADEPGQYRMSFKVTDSKSHTIEGGYVFQIIGDEGKDGNFRFNDIEIVPDKKEYANGEKALVLIKTNRADSTVLLFSRPSNGTYLKPDVMYIQGKTQVKQIEITKKDMPNFFVEAVTVSNGKIHTEIREIIVPPEKRILNLDIIPSKAEYKPGEKAKIKLKVTDFFGKPFQGSLVTTIYDKALEYISGGSNIPEIRAYFWKWRRNHNPRLESNAGKYFHNLLKRNELSMRTLGVFGNIIVSDKEGFEEPLSDGNALGSVKKSFRSKNAVMRKAKSDVMMEAEEKVAAAPSIMGKEEQALGGRSQDSSKQPVQPAIRTKFADTAFWNGNLKTNEEGLAEIEFDMPENITGWKIKSWALGHGTKVGEGEALVVTKKNLMLRMQTPRFFVEKDEVVLSANIHNYLKTDKNVTAILEIEGESLSHLGKSEQKITIKPGADMRVDWRIKVIKEGKAIIRMKALTDAESDAMEMDFPVYVHGMQKTVSFSGAMRSEDNESIVEFDVPTKRRKDETSLEVRYSPSLAGAMAGALPYLADYPYGCTEQTLNRFLPSVITRKILTDMGINLKDIKNMQTNLNAQEIGNDPERLKQWKRWKRNPVFDEKILNDMIYKGLTRLYTMQLSDGGWGWFSGYGEHSSAHTTAVVVHGLMLCKEYGLNPENSSLQRGIAWLDNYQEKQIRRLDNYQTKKDPCKSKADNLDAIVFMILTESGKYNEKMDDYLYRDRNHLSVYGKSVYGLGLFRQGIKERYSMIIRNISQYEVYDDENQSAHLKLPNDGYWWYWFGSEFEAHAYYLKLLSKTDPKNKIASGIVKYIINNRKHSTYWNSTRDTAICIEALAEYMKASGETKPDLNLQILLDGKIAKKTHITSENLFSFDNQLLIKGDEITEGSHRLKFLKSGKGPIYYNAYLSYFSLEDFITHTGLEIKVNRKYFKLTEKTDKIKVATDKGAALDQKVLKYERKEITSGEALKSGDLLEIEMTVESKNDYEYIVIEDMKPAGCEPVEVRSGYNGNDLGAYVEFRDNRVSFFVRMLARGKNSVSYRMRAEIPGKFSALPSKMFAMYAPELKSNSDEIKIEIED